MSSIHASASALAGGGQSLSTSEGERTCITVLVLTFNEERNLPPLLESVAGWPAQVFVVDSGSTDRTNQIARNAGATVFHHPFESHSEQWRWALENLPISTDWVLGLDADQRVTPALRTELLRRFRAKGSLIEDGIHGFYVARRQIFRGSWIRHGGYYPKYLLKLFRRGQVRFDELDFLDHHFYVSGDTGILSGDVIEENRNEDDISFWVEKHSRYAIRVAREELLRRRGGGEWPQQPSLWASPDQRVMWLKRAWYRIPLYMRPLLYFVYRYVLRLGFLDGKQGFIFHFLHAFWFRLLVDIHLDDLLTSASSTLYEEESANVHSRH